MAVRTVVLVSVDGSSSWTVIEGDRFCERLTPDEALGMCARLMLNTQFPPYPMDTFDQFAQKAVDRALKFIKPMEDPTQ